MRRALAFSALAVLSCAGGRAEPPLVVPISTVPTESAPLIVEPPPVAKPSGEGVRPLGEMVLDGARAMLAAARGEPHEARWDCDDAAHDLRATDANLRSEFAALGKVSMIAAGVDRLELSSPARGDGRFFHLRMEALVWPDARVGFFETKSTLNEENASSALPVSSVAPSVRRGLESLVSGLTGARCVLPPITEADIDALPIGEKEREKGRRELRQSAEHIERVCADAKEATGPWSVEARGLIVVLSDGQKLGGIMKARFRARPNGTVCLERLEVNAK